jgi:hypothetical protein
MIDCKLGMQVSKLRWEVRRASLIVDCLQFSAWLPYSVGLHVAACCGCRIISSSLQDKDMIAYKHAGVSKLRWR